MAVKQQVARKEIESTTPVTITAGNFYHKALSDYQIHYVNVKVLEKSWQVRFRWKGFFSRRARWKGPVTFFWKGRGLFKVTGFWLRKEIEDARALPRSMPCSRRRPRPKESLQCADLKAFTFSKPERILLLPKTDNGNELKEQLQQERPLTEVSIMKSTWTVQWPARAFQSVAS